MPRIRPGNSARRLAGDPKLVNVVPESFQTQMCGMLLESTLNAARLPEAVSHAHPQAIFREDI